VPKSAPGSDLPETPQFNGAEPPSLSNQSNLLTRQLVLMRCTSDEGLTLLGRREEHMARAASRMRFGLRPPLLSLLRRKAAAALLPPTVRKHMMSLRNQQAPATYRGFG
jgi:hypothetical protein